MTRNLKALGLALIAVFAMCAVVASAAQAQATTPVLTTENGEEVTIKGTQGTTILKLTRNTRNVSCGVANLHGVANNGAETIDLTPEYKECTTNLGGPATITTVGCFFRFHLTADAKEPEDTWTAHAGLHCEKGKHVVIHAYLNENEHNTKVNEPTCQYTFTDANAAGEQTKTNQLLGTIDLTNEGPGGITPKNWILAHVDLKKIHSTRTRGSTLLCGPEVHETGELHGTYNLKGKTTGGADLGITISTKPKA